MLNITFKSIGYISSPFKKVEDIPAQSIFAKEKVATIKLLDEYQDGLRGLENYSHIVIQFYFHKTNGYDLLTSTPWDNEEVGVFATRSPKRPNPIGISIVKLRKIEGCNIEIEGVDMLDQTPVIDIKPYAADLNPKN